MMDDGQGADICRVCRSEGLPDRPLFHPCICTGSIKWIHQECLVQWMRYSRKEYCELCSYKFSFMPIYAPDMPRRLPVKDILGGLLSSILTAVKHWIHYTLVAIAWLGIVPLLGYRIYKCLFTGTLDSIMSLPFNLISTDHLASDIIHGSIVVVCTLFAFIALVWLREQILHGGGPDWLERDGNLLAPGHNNNEHNIQNNNNNNEEEERGAGEEEEGEGNNNNNVNNNNELPREPDNIPAMNNVEGPAGAAPRAGNAGPAQAARIEGGGAGVGDDLDGVGGGGGGNVDNNWNPIEWDRAAEELTWERLLGLDGSLVFLEHVFWVVSLNTLFILVFAFCPYHMGRFMLSIATLKHYVSASKFEGLLTTLCGYVLVGLTLVVLHSLASFFNLTKSRRVLGLCYIVVKVSLLCVIEIGVLPLICGWWLDVCSLSMFEASLKDRLLSLKTAPGTCMFIHWLLGMIYVYYFASFILLLREVLRPGVLWFLRNLNDPDFSPIQEMIHLPILRHIRRLIVSGIIFGTVVLLMLWLPIRIIRTLMPSFLPYRVTLTAESQINELSLELLLLQVVLPAILEQTQTRVWLKNVIRVWCRVVSYFLNIKSYLLGDETESSPRHPVRQEANFPALGNDLGAAHQALLQIGGPTGFQPYTRPSYFLARIGALLGLVCVSLVVSSFVLLTVPVWLGRRAMMFWPAIPVAPRPGATVPSAPLSPTSGPGIHELYTASCGLYLCWLGAKMVTVVRRWLPLGRVEMMRKLGAWSMLAAKMMIGLIILIGIIPLLFGLCLELIIVVPFRVPLDQTPVLWIWHNWALGVLYTKIAAAITMMGPDWPIKRTIEALFRNGFREMSLRLLLTDLALPVICSLSLILSVPYITAYSIVPLFVRSNAVRNIVARRIYPFILVIVVVLFVIYIQVEQFIQLYEHIKNDKYLIGRTLVNYNSNSRKTKSSSRLRLSMLFNLLSKGYLKLKIRQLQQSLSFYISNKLYHEKLTII
uniref:E3 ubiquitin-protein ligase MARCHF6 n=1 Tax=Cacopsylla melanoneura TaxID=428564 RepID=A0A8D9BVB0_9HEMI